MIDLGRRSVLGVWIDALDYEAATERVIRAAEDGAPLAGTALAVHGVMTGVRSLAHRARLNDMDLVTPDGQPVRWALTLLYRGVRLPDRVYGPVLMRRICVEAAARSLPIYLYGSREEVLAAMARRLPELAPGIRLAGCEPSKFRSISREELTEVAARIRASGARVVFVGLGCPRQETFAHELRGLVSMPVLAVGAAFDYHAGLLREPPAWIQRMGLQWLYRLVQEPGRLWRRYALLNPAYLMLLGMQAIGLYRPRRTPRPPVLPALDG